MPKTLADVILKWDQFWSIWEEYLQKRTVDSKLNMHISCSLFKLNVSVHYSLLELWPASYYPVLYVFQVGLFKNEMFNKNVFPYHMKFNKNSIEIFFNSFHISYIKFNPQKCSTALHKHLWYLCIVWLLFLKCWLICSFKIIRL